MSGLAGPLLLVGCGKMGGALLAGWIANGLRAADTYVVEPDAALRTAARERHRVAAVAEPHELPTDLRPQAIVFAVKPQAMALVLPAYEPLARSGAVVLSIAAGTAIARFEAAFGAATPVVRAMPNTPAAIGQGVTALFANGHASARQRELCAALMAAVGQVLWIDDEEQMHAITAMSGSGPAYVFYLIEVLAKAAIENGLPEGLAWPIARATVAGSAALAASSRETVETLRRQVTSPAGTTEAALKVLMAPDGMQSLFARALAAATQRSRELA
ncbi:MAG TPA: pyrroline-5-carboxylate reductase [Geminicoccaceae bacterium]|nr:pyrroline-5-carboxylate reductase [Geminicoccaceae bacterium]